MTDTALQQEAKKIYTCLGEPYDMYYYNIDVLDIQRSAYIAGIKSLAEKIRSIGEAQNTSPESKLQDILKLIQ